MLRGDMSSPDVNPLHLLYLAAQRSRHLVGTIRHIDKEPGARHLLPGNRQHRRTLALAKHDLHPVTKGFPPAVNTSFKGNGGYAASRSTWPMPALK